MWERVTPMKLNMVKYRTHSQSKLLWKSTQPKRIYRWKTKVKSKLLFFYFCSADITAMTLRLLGESPFDTCHSWTLKGPVQSAHAPTMTAKQVLVDLVKSLPAIIAKCQGSQSKCSSQRQRNRSSHCAAFFRSCQSGVKSRACPKENEKFAIYCRK